MNEPGVSLEFLDRLVEIEQDKAMEAVLRRHGFTDADFFYRETGWGKKLLIKKNVVDYFIARKESVENEIKETMNTGMTKGLASAQEAIKLMAGIGKGGE